MCISGNGRKTGFTAVLVWVVLRQVVAKSQGSSHVSLATQVLSKDFWIASNVSQALEKGWAIQQDVEDASGSLLRRGGPVSAFRLCRLVLLAAVMTSIMAAWSTGQKQTQNKWQMEEHSLAESAYPWPTLPPYADVAAAGLTFTSVGSTMQLALLAHGLLACRRGTALISACHPRGGSNSAVVERRLEISSRRPFAMQVHRLGLQELAPTTFRRPNDMSKSLVAGLNSVARRTSTEEEPAEVLWFLKHSAAHGEPDGITCFEDARSLLAFWLAMPKTTRCSFVAQQAIRQPMRVAGGHVKVHAFVLALENGPSFLHRELLLTTTPTDDLAQASPPSILRGRSWVHYASVWPRLQHVLGRVLQHRCWRWSKAQPAKEGVQHQEARGKLLYNIFMVDAAIDQSAKPWLLDMYPMPDEQPFAEELVSANLWKDVTQDACRLLLKPFLGPVQSDNKVSSDAQVAATSRDAQSKQLEMGGFVSLSQCAT
ncbi:unnamed protein product [Symbiodinium pilosum]|uniref:Uncharacterized protein n=1 Tax=Symbiodinium pilosum TaxID=2952 RepID=A0A812V7N6_SYMPI|nr:unnamed protein product [Symbiodinium pilosum]